MTYRLTPGDSTPKVDQYGIHIGILPQIAGCGVVTVETTEGHHQEFYHKISTFNYIVLKGEGSFFLDDEEVPVKKGDMLSVAPNTRIYYKGAMSMVLITNPAWSAEGEIETRAQAW